MDHLQSFTLCFCGCLWNESLRCEGSRNHRCRPSLKIGTFSGASTLVDAPEGLFKLCKVGVIVPVGDEETEVSRD